MYSELRFEHLSADKKFAPSFRYLIDYCGKGTDGCEPINNYLKYNRTFNTPPKFNLESNLRVVLIHHGLTNETFTHVGCVSFMIPRN